MNTNVVTSKKIDEIFKHSFVYGLTGALQNVIAFILLPILTSYYTPEIFGVYSILLLMSTLASSIFSLGASSALGRFYFDEDSDLFRKKVLTSNLLLTLMGGGLVVLVGIIFSKTLSVYLFQTDIYSKPILITLIGTAFGFLLILMTNLLRYEKKSYLFFLITIFGFIVNFLITLGLLSLYDFGLLAPIYGSLISNGLCFLILLIMSLQLLTKKIEFNHIRLFLNFGFQVSISGFLFYVLEWVDRLIINDLLNLSDVGIYSLGYRLGSLMNVILVFPFALVWAPFRMQHSKDNDFDIFSGKILSYYTIAGVLILMFFILFGDNLIRLIFVNNEYSSASNVFSFIMFAYFLYGYQNIVDFGIYLHKKVYVYILISLLAIILNVMFNYLLIPKWGYMAAAYISVLTYLLTSTSIYFLSKKYFAIRIETKRIIFPLAYVFFLLCSNSIISGINLFFRFILLLISLYIVYFYWFSNNERLHLYNKYMALIKRVC